MNNQNEIHPLVRGLHAQNDWIGKLHNKIRRVYELHKPFVMAPNRTLCDHCWDPVREDYYEYPCPTIKALEGELDD